MRNTALGRNHISRQEFMDTMIADIGRIQQVPVELRWFVQDDQDAELLLRHDDLAFTNPRDPEIHHDEFLAECQTRMVSEPAADGTEN